MFVVWTAQVSENSGLGRCRRGHREGDDWSVVATRLTEVSGRFALTVADLNFLMKTDGEDAGRLTVCESPASGRATRRRTSSSMILQKMKCRGMAGADGQRVSDRPGIFPGYQTEKAYS